MRRTAEQYQRELAAKEAHMLDELEAWKHGSAKRAIVAYAWLRKRAFVPIEALTVAGTQYPASMVRSGLAFAIERRKAMVAHG